MGGVLVVAAWTVVFVRIVSFGATLRMRTLFSFVVAGALLGATAVPLVDRVADPYNGGVTSIGPVAITALSALRLLALVAPVLAFVGRRQIRAKTSVADGFLVGFAVGLGFEVSGLLFALAHASDAKGINVFAPFTADIHGTVRDTVYTGAGYWLGAIGLAVAAAARFLRGRFAGLGFGVLAFIVVALDQVSALSANLAAPFAPADWLSTLTDDGSRTAWLVIVVLVLLEILEARRVRAARPDDAGAHELAVVRSSVFRGDFPGARLAFDRWRLTRQVLLSRVDRDAHPQLDDVAIAARQAEDAVVDGPTGTRPMSDLARLAVAPAIPTALALLVVFGLPHWGDGIHDVFWDSHVVFDRVFSLPLSVLDLVLVGAVFWWFLRRGARSTRPAADADTEVAHQVDDILLQTALAGAVLAITYLRRGVLSPWTSAIASFERLPVLALSANQLTTLMLLVSAGVAGFAALRGAEWRSLPITERRRVVVPNAMMAMTAVVLAVVGVGVYEQLLPTIHDHSGSWLFDTFGDSGNDAGALITGLIAGVVAVIAATVVRYGGRRVTDFLTAEEGEL